MLNTNKLKNKALTLTETIVVIAAIAIALVLLTPALKAERSSSRSMVCLANLKSLNTAVHIYAKEHDNVLPNPTHPAVNRHQTIEYWYSIGADQYNEGENFYSRQLAPRLQSIVGTDIDRITTCPTLEGIASDSHFAKFRELNERMVASSHYTLNTWSEDGTRHTNPSNYFGNSPSFLVGGTPRRIGEIGNPSEEWIIADAWYRPNTNTGLTDLQQEGSYQSSWSGEALPHFAPHCKRGSTKLYPDPAKRSSEVSRIRINKLDGITNTAYFDGHVASVPSRKLSYNGFEVFYGYPGTVNQNFTNPTAQFIWENGKWE